jgi:phage terminase large subunit-like protein
MRDYVAITRQYCDDIISGKRLACELTKLACQRQLNDLAASQDESFPWIFDADHAARACEFIERCPHTTGKKWDGKLITLDPWQVFVTTTIFGWKSRATGLRLFRQAFILAPKGSGKSTWTAAICNFAAFADGEPGAQVFLASDNATQARRDIFRIAQQQMEKMPSFRERFGVEVSRYAISQTGTGSFMQVLSRDGGVAEGSIPSLVVLDELHLHKTRDLFDNCQTACDKRDDSLLLQISTAGTDPSSICYEQYELAKAILEGVKDDPTFFAVIYGIDAGDDPWTIESAEKANPGWGTAVNPDKIAEALHAAKQSPGKQATYQTKHLNCWLNNDAQWLNMTRVLACADPDLKESDFVGQMSTLGLDLGRKLDLLAKATLFWKEIDGKRHYYTFGKYWTPEESLQDSNNASYQKWKDEGWLITCDGNENDFTLVEDDIREDCKKYTVLEVGHDQWAAAELVQNLRKEGITMHEVAQLPRDLSEPMKELEAAIESGRFHFNGDPVLIWAFNNVVCVPDKNDNYFPRKKGSGSSPHKIDPVSALLDALNRCIALHLTGAIKPRRTEVLVFD